MAASRRQYTRSLCFARCLLVGADGSNHEVLMKNISYGGALLKPLEGGIPESLAVNKDCSLMMCRNPELCPSRYACTIVWMEEEHFGVEFIDN